MKFPNKKIFVDSYFTKFLSLLNDISKVLKSIFNSKANNVKFYRKVLAKKEIFV